MSKCQLHPCEDQAEFMVHRDGGLNLKYCDFHTKMAIDQMSKIDIPLRVQRLTTLGVKGK